MAADSSPSIVSNIAKTAFEWIKHAGEWLVSAAKSTANGISAFVQDPKGTVTKAYQTSRDWLRSSINDGSSYCHTLTCKQNLNIITSQDVTGMMQQAHAGAKTTVDTAITSAEYCRATYHRLDSDAYRLWQDQMKTQGCTVIPIGVEDGRARGFVIRNAKGEYEVSFRGTKGMQDVMKDARYGLTQLDGGKGMIHRGFEQESERLMGEILAAIPNDARTVRFSGHSLGGALASLAALKYSERKKDRLSRKLPLEAEATISVTTFGSPDTGNCEFATRYAAANIETFHFVNHTDPVPHLCPRSMGYTSTGVRIGIKDNAVFLVPPGQEGAHNPALGMMNLAITGMSTTHRVNHYRDSLMKARDEYNKALQKAREEALKNKGSMSFNGIDTRQPQEGIYRPAHRGIPEAGQAGALQAL